MIDGVAIAGYRSFGDDLRFIGPLKKVNVLIGQNNSGKSNVLRYMKDHYRRAALLTEREYDPIELTGVDRHIGSKTGKVRFGFGLDPAGPLLQTLSDRHKKILANSVKIQRLVETVLRLKALQHGTGIAWFVYEADWSEKIRKLKLSDVMRNEVEAEEGLASSDWYTLWHAITGKTGGDPRAHWIPETLAALCPATFDPPEVVLIPAIRQVGGVGQKAQTAGSDDYSGTEIISRLARLQNPSYDRQELREEFQKINRFLQVVTGNNRATVEIPFERDTVVVHMDGKHLPLASLGTGIHEVVILASAATVLKNQVVCIEEPEIHLHPTLQKKLVRYLIESTENQYLIASHSAHLIDADVSVFHVREDGGTSVVSPVQTANDKWLICKDLGYRASDLMQANSIIWVEGPSDRIYLNHWLSAVDKSLTEGLHYSIMFYGGRLLSHLTADDPEIEEFISLRRLNRNVVVVMDSDKDYPDKLLNDTKLRVQTECDKVPGFAWVTTGREVENYIPDDVIADCISDVHPQARRSVGKGQYANCVCYLTDQGEERTDVDKVKLAKKVTERPPQLDVLDLRTWVERLVNFIRQANT